jgi:hypothetical protein
MKRTLVLSGLLAITPVPTNAPNEILNQAINLHGYEEAISISTENGTIILRDNTPPRLKKRIKPSS